MKKIISFLTGLLAIIGCSTSIAQQAKKSDNSLLWQVSGKKLTKPSYIFGTMHLICADDYLWTEKMNASLERSDKICFEMDMDDPKVLSEVATGLIDNSGKKLEDYFTPEQYVIVSKYVKDSIGMDISMLEHMKPVVLQTMLSSTGISCDNAVSYEDSLMKIANRKKKEILGLEEPKEQIAVLESIPADSVIHELLEMIQGKKTDDSDYNKLVASYRKQDINALHVMIRSSKELGDMGIFLDGRNRKWVPRMSDKMNVSSVFFAVGAGHLAGENGIISLLRKDGYTVESVK